MFVCGGGVVVEVCVCVCVCVVVVAVGIGGGVRWWIVRWCGVCVCVCVVVAAAAVVVGGVRVCVLGGCGRGFLNSLCTYLALWTW